MTGVATEFVHLRYSFVQDTTIEGYSKVGGLIGEYKRGEIVLSYVDADIKATAHTAGGIVGYINNIGMTNANNTSKIYKSYVANSTLEAPEKVGGIIGDSDQTLLAGNYYYNNLVEANITTDNMETASLGIGGRKQDSTLANTYVYKYSKLNGEYVNTTNDTFTEENYVTIENLKNKSFYTQTLAFSYFIYDVLNQNKYPILSSTYNSSEQTGIDLPEEPTGEISVLSEELPQVTAYSLRANRLNVDLSSVPSGTTLTYGTDDTEETTIDVENRTYTFEYDYQTPITLTLANRVEEETIVINPEDVRNTASVESNTIAYLENESLIVNGEKVEGSYKNLVDGEALLEDGNIYNIAENTVEETNGISLALVETEAKEEYNYYGNEIETYGTYSVINGKETEAIYTVRDQTLSITDGKLEDIQSGKIVDSYNGNEYETILGTDGKLYNLKTAIKYPEDFKNEGIKTIAVDSSSEERIAVVQYENGSVEAFNYMTGETKYEQIKKEDIGLWEYMQSKLEKEETTSMQESYEVSKKVEEKLQVKPLEEETGKNAKYITMYNSETKTHEIYKEEELLNLSSEEAKSETEKIQEDEELKEYYLNTEGEKIQIQKGFYLVMGSIAGVLISLVILRKITIRKRQKKNKHT